MADSDNPLPVQPDDNPWLSAPTDTSGRPVITVTPRIAQNNTNSGNSGSTNLVDPNTGIDYSTYTDPLIDDVKNAAAKLFGLNGEQRYQLWPERLARSALTAPADALTGQIQPGSDEEIARAMDMASLSGVGAMPASLTEEGALASGITKMKMPTSTADSTAPVFYSAVENAVNNAKIDNAPVSQWLGYLKNQPGVKQEELDWTLGDLPIDQKMSKSDMQDYVDLNKVQLNEVNKTSYDPVDLIEEKYASDLDGAAQHQFGQSYDSLTDSQQQDIRALALARQNILPTKYQSYQLPGGSNYKEMLLQLPLGRRVWLDGSPVTEEDLSTQFGRDAADRVSSYETAPYTSSHWDEPNVLAHIRMNDRNINDDGFTVQNNQSGNTGPVFDTQEQAQAYQDNLPSNLKTKIISVQKPIKTLHLEEIQSDWHQQGRQRGYQLTPAQKAAFDAIDQKIIDSGDEDVMGDPNINSAIGKAVDKKLITADEGKIYLQNYRGTDAKNPVPNAPFKQSWPDLVLKRMIRYASDNGYDAISWTPGEAQAARYDLSKHLKELEYVKIPKSSSVSGEDRYALAATRTSGEGFDFPQQNYSESELTGIVGKEIAQKIVDGEGKHYRGHDGKTLEGIDLKVGGEGMKAFYDKMLVDKANGIAKKYGGKVEDRTISYGGNPYGNKYGIEKGDDGRYYITTPDGRTGESFSTRQAANHQMTTLMQSATTRPIHFLRLPKSLKDTAQQKGFPLFSGGFMLNPVQQNPFASESVDVDGQQIPINNQQDVMWGAGASNSSNIVNIDKRIPRFDSKLKLPDGRPADLYKYLAIHETTEKREMERLIAQGTPKDQAYTFAHTHVATPAEKAAVKADGLDWDEYEKIIDGYLKLTEHEKPSDVPSDLYTKPYSHMQLRKMNFKPLDYDPFGT